MSECDHCRDPDGEVWRCPKCGWHCCKDCLFSQIDCYLDETPEYRACPWCHTVGAGEEMPHG